MRMNLLFKRNPFLGRGNWHSMMEIFFLDHLLHVNRFNRIIELGGMQCGMTIIFGIHALRMGAEVKTFDIRSEPKDITYTKLKEVLPIEFHQMNVFGPEAHKLIRAYMEEGRVLLYCDNGDKDREFNTYAPYLKPNDVIMAHDCGTRELKWKDIEETVVKYNLKPLYGLEIFAYGVSDCCFIKQGDDSDS